MDGFDGHPGTARLAAVLSQRMQKTNEAPLLIDFGEIQGNGSLMTNTFPVPIPKGDYSVCRHVGGLRFVTEGGGHEGHEGQTKTYHTGAHSHTIEPPVIKPGDRVLVVWVQNEAVVIDVITKT